MNHIQRLTQERDEAQAKVKAMEEEIAAFRKHLASSKFWSTDTQRNDWISTADVNRWLDNIQNAE